MADEEIDIDFAEDFGAVRVDGQRFAIYLPNKDRNGDDIDQAKWIFAFVELLSDIGGGATVMPPVRGAWKNEDTDELIIEEPVVVYSFVKAETLKSHLSKLVGLTHAMGRETNQGEVVFEFDGELHRIVDFNQGK